MPRPKLTHPDRSTPQGQLALYIDHLMRKRNLTPETIAEAAGVSRSIVFRWLSGGCSPSFRYWPAIAECLGLVQWQDLVPPPQFIATLQPKPGNARTRTPCRHTH